MRTLDELTTLLKENGIDQLVDVRHYPRSRRNPQANFKVLETELPAAGIRYVWEGEDLGGLRDGGFRAYMTTPRFASGIRRLVRLADQAPTAIMCAEASPAACHRRFIAREMTARGYRVRHIGTR